MSRSMFYRKSKAPGQAELRMRIREIAMARQRFGYQRIHVLLRPEGWKINHKRVHRLHCQEGLQVRMRVRRRKRLSLHGGPAPVPKGRNMQGDHALAVAGSIKARGGIYEVLVHAEQLALLNGVMNPDGDRVVRASPVARTLLTASDRRRLSWQPRAGHRMLAAALGFRTIVHMSHDSKEWKKARLHAHGVEVVEHEVNLTSYTAADLPTSSFESISPVIATSPLQNA